MTHFSERCKTMVQFSGPWLSGQWYYQSAAHGEDSNRSLQRNDRGLTSSAKAVMILNHILCKYYMYIDIDIYHTYAFAYPSASYLSASFWTFYEPLR